MWTEQVVCFYSLYIVSPAEGWFSECPACKMLLLHLAGVHVALDQEGETESHQELEGGEMLWMSSLNYTPFSKCLQLLLWPKTT